MKRRRPLSLVRGELQHGGRRQLGSSTSGLWKLTTSRRGIVTSASLGSNDGVTFYPVGYTVVSPTKLGSTTKDLRDCCGRTSSCAYYASGNCNGTFSRCCSTAKEEMAHQHEHHEHTHEHHECHPKFGSSPKCWSCEKFLIRSSLFCSSCNKVQPLYGDYNAFEVLGMPKTFNTDLKLLEKHYWALQRRVHPDLFHQKSKLEKDYSALISSHLNKAYQTLKNPETRAKYMLKMQGVNFEEELRLDNPELLMEVMEIRSQIDEVKDQEELKKLAKENNERLDSYYKKLQVTFDKQDLEEAKRLVAELQYFVRIRDELWSKIQ